MEQNEKVANDKVSKLESEIKVLKNEVQAVLLDLRESYLNMENPFTQAANPTTIQPIVIQERAQEREQAPAREPKANQSKEAPTPEAPKAEKETRVETEDKLAERVDKLEQIREETKPAPPQKLMPQADQALETEDKKTSDLDLVTVAGLIAWAEDSAQKLGQERAEALLDISEAMGCLSSELKPILVKMLALAPQGIPERPTRSRDYIESLIKINSLFGRDKREESALLLLSLVSGDKTNG